MTDKKEKPITKQRPAAVPIFDVAPPGTLPPADASARPVIVSNRVTLHDPMIAEPNPPASRITPLPIIAKRIIVPSADAPVVASQSTPVSTASQQSAAASGIKSYYAAPATTATQPDPADSDTIDTTTGPNGLETEQSKADRQAAELEASAKAQDELDTLIETKAYFLPINSVGQRRSQRVAAFGAIIIVLLGLAWADLALDAGFISLPGVKPVTHLFRK